MTFFDWVNESSERVRQNGARGVARSLEELWIGVLRRFEPMFPGRNIWDEEWDVLVVLDACRFDLMAEVIDEVAYLPRVERFRGVSSSTSEWIQENLNGEDLSSVAYVTGNPLWKTNLDDRDRFMYMEDVGQDVWDEQLGTIPPAAITDRAIEIHEDLRPEKMIVHYMQPHHPFVRSPIAGATGMQRVDWTDNVDPWDLLQRSEVSRETVWTAYRENLEFVLEEVAVLIEQLEGSIVVTSDHGNSLGRLGIYGHPPGVPLPCLRDVPWIEVQGGGAYDHQARDVHGERGDLQQRLENLGYA